jgi:hypothetical protein
MRHAPAGPVVSNHNDTPHTLMATIAWLIPRLIEGSGGHRTMLEHALALERHGHRCHLYLEGTHTDPDKGSQLIEQIFGYTFERVSFGWDAIQPADAPSATIWYSAAFVRDLPFRAASCTSSRITKPASTPWATPS